MKGMYSATICPAITLYLAQNGLSQAYCGWGEYSWGYLIFQFLFIWIGTDFYEFYYHRWGHTSKFGWNQHKNHHLFFNPSPFAVIADEYVDQFVRAAPLLIFPILLPINIDLMFFEFAILFYGYGTYLHWGFELDYPDAHHPIINTAFQHYLHHAISIMNKPYHTGFFFRIWDRLFDSEYHGECFCSKCCREKGLRSREIWDKLDKPNYSPLLKPSFWLEAFTSKSSSS